MNFTIIILKRKPLLFENNFFNYLKKKTTVINLSGQNRYLQECASLCENSSSISCCQTDNCNNLTLKTIVSSCLQGGNWQSEVFSINKPVNIKNCESPKNQWCMLQKVPSQLVSIDMFSCSDSCIPIDTPELIVKCCQKDNCNTPVQQSKLSCIKSSRLNDFTPASILCNPEENFCYVLFLDFNYHQILGYP